MTKIHGVVSITFFFLTQVLAVTAGFLESPVLGAGYTGLFILASLAVCYFYCTKCPVRLTDCSHVLVGPVTRIFPARRQDHYTSIDYIAVVTSLGLMIAIPQFWLWKHSGLMIAFWIFLILAGIQINRYVCKECNNLKCIACRKQPGLN